MSSTQEAGTPHPLAPQVPEIKHVYHHMPNATDAEAQETTRKVLAQTYTDEVVLTPFEMGRAVPEVGGAPGWFSGLPHQHTLPPPSSFPSQDHRGDGYN